MKLISNLMSYRHTFYCNQPGMIGQPSIFAKLIDPKQPPEMHNMTTLLMFCKEKEKEMQITMGKNTVNRTCTSDA